MNFARWAAPIVALSALSCSVDDSDEIVDTWMEGHFLGAGFRAGPGAATIEADGSAVIRIFEEGVVVDACSADPTAGRRIEIHMAQFLTGRHEASDNDGWYVEAWNGTSGVRDPQSLIEIDVAQKELGGDVIGRARFGSPQSGDLVEGRFEAVVCSVAAE